MEIADCVTLHLPVVKYNSRIHSMILSKYNYLYKSKRYKKNFIYNSRSSSFISVSLDLYNKLIAIKGSSQQEKDIEDIDNDIKEAFTKAKVFVSKLEDDNFVQQKKLLKYTQSFQERELGLVVVPTFACNFACPYCYECNLPAIFMDEKTEDQIVQFIRKSRGADMLHLCWHGGEPLLAFENIKRILKKIELEDSVKLKSHSIVTNGYLLDESKCSFFRDYNLDTIQITIDGLREQHNKSRIHKKGNPTFDIILNNIEKVFEIMPSCHVIIRMNVHAQNEKDYPLLHKMLTQRWGDQNYSIQMKYANDHGRGCRVACVKNKNKAAYIQNMCKSNSFRGVISLPSPQIGGCAATHINTYVIGTTGELYKCWVDVGKKEKIVGSIFSDSYNTALISQYILGTDMFSDKKCLECILLPACDGGCNLRRLDYKISDEPFDNCPINMDELDVVLDAFYEIKTFRCDDDSKQAKFIFSDSVF